MFFPSEKYAAAFGGAGSLSKKNFRYPSVRRLG